MENQLTVLAPEIIAEQKISAIEPIKNMLERLSEIDNLVIAGVDDKVGYKAVDTLRKEFKDVAVMVEGKCKEEREEALRTQKMWVAIEKKLSAPFREAEAKLKAKIDAIDAEKKRIADEAEKQAVIRMQTRCALLTDNGCSFDGHSYSIANHTISTPIIKEMEDDDFNNFISLVKIAHAEELADAAAKALELRTEERKTKCQMIGLTYEAGSYTYSCTYGSVGIITAEITDCTNEAFNALVVDVQTKIDGWRKNEIEAQQEQARKLEEDRKALLKEKIDLRIEKLEAIGLLKGNGCYHFENKYYSSSFSDSDIEVMDNEAFNRAIAQTKSDIATAKEKQVASDQIEGERKQLIATRAIQLREIGLVADGDNYKHPLYSDTIINTDIMDTDESNWNEVIAMLSESIAIGKKNAEEKRKQDLEDAAERGRKEEAARVEAARLKKIADDAAELAEKERQAALAPDKEKLQKLSATIHDLQIPECSTEEGKKIADDVRSLLLKVETHIANKVKAL